MLGGNMPREKRRKTTRFAVSSDEDEDDIEEDYVEIVGPSEKEIREMIERRKERRRSSIYHGEGSILFAASKVIKKKIFSTLSIILGTITIPAKSTQQSNAAENQAEVQRQSVRKSISIKLSSIKF